MAFGDFTMPGAFSLPWSVTPDDSSTELAPIHRRPITSEQAETTLGRIANAGLARLGYVGSTLDKMLGTRSLRALIDTAIGSHQHASDILSVLPFSETLGITSPENAVSGAELSKNVTGYDPSQGTWAERNLVGPAIEIALDPAMYLGGIGALTEAGKLALKAGELTPGFLESIGAGERGLVYGLSGPETEAAVRSALGGIGQANQALRTAVPRVARLEDVLGQFGGKVKTTWGALFDPLAGGSYDPIIQQMNREVRFPRQFEIEKDILGSEADLREAYRKLVPADADPREYSQYLTQLIEDIDPTLRRVPAGAEPQVLTGLEDLAGQIRGRYQAMVPAERGLGLPSIQLSDPLIEYAHRRAIKAPTGLYSSMADRGAAESRLIGERQRLLTDIPGGTVQIQQWVADPGLAGANALLSREQRVNRVLADLTRGLPERINQLTGANQFGEAGTLAGVLEAAPGRAEKIANFLEQVKPEYIAEVEGGRPRLPFFGMDPFEDLRLRGMAHAQRMGTAEGIWSVLKKYAQEGQMPGSRPLTDVMNRLRIGTKTGREGAAEKAAELFGLEVPPEVLDVPTDYRDRINYFRDQMRGYSLPENVAQALLHEQTGYHIPEALQPVLKATDWFSNLFKSALYGPWPASHARNLISGEWENMMAPPTGMGKTPFGQTSREAFDILRGGTPDLPIPGWEALTPEEKAFRLRRELYARGGIGLPPGEINETIGRPLSTAERPNPAEPWTQTAGEFLKEATARPGAWNPLDIESFVPYQAGRQVGTNVENYLRLSQYNDLLQKGWDLDAAAKMVEKTHFNYYSALTDFEKNVMKRLVPFYTYSRFNFPKQVERILQEPVKSMVPIRLLAQGQLGTQGPGFIPQYLAGSLAIPLGPESETGTQRYLAGLGLPFEEAFGRIRGGVGPLSMAGRTLEGLMGMTTPFVKAPIEWATGEQLFSGRELPTLTPSTLLSALVGEQAARPLNQLVVNTPASRVLSTLDRLLDLRKDPLTKLMSLTTGVNITDVEQEKQRGREIQRLVRDYLETVPYMSESTDFYVSPKNRGKVSERDLEVLDLARYQQAQARKAQKRHPQVTAP